jgi:lipopolysaccharide transport system ATP-binding protein
VDSPSGFALIPDEALRFDHVAKRFPVFPNSLARLRAALVPFRRGEPTTVEVLRDVDFRVARGECVAILGPNGTGKSTILHLAAGLLEPSAGTVTVHGSVSSLLDLGGSFLPELTGRENACFFREVVAGESDSPDAWERSVEEFADIGAYFDRPVHTYSNGMFLRLAFACASSGGPDVLLVDELIAVGDARFQQKCFRRLRQLRENGSTIVLVTHLVHHVTALCDRALVLDRGELVYDGPPRAGVDRYYELFFMASGRTRSGQGEDEFRYGDGGVEIGDPAVSHADADRSGPFCSGDRLAITFAVRFRRDVHEPQIGFGCSTAEGTHVYGTTSSLLGEEAMPAAVGALGRVEIEFRVPLAVADLFVDLTAYEVVDGQVSMLDARIGVLHLSIVPPRDYVGIADLEASIHTTPLTPVGLPGMAS